MALLALLFHPDNIGSFSNPHEVTLWSSFSQSASHLGNEVMMEISPQPAGFDIWVHPWKWRFHELLLRRFKGLMR
jgi:hypothetical protein